jgi:hypothetical protein
MGVQLSVNAKGVDWAFFLAGGVNTPLIGQFANIDTKFILKCDPSTRSKRAFNAGRVYGALIGQFSNIGTKRLNPWRDAIHQRAVNRSSTPAAFMAR